MSSIEKAIARPLEGSLRRLGMERVDIFHLHNPITAVGVSSPMEVRPAY
jgi:aryl-alcohol dehydrogenase-like predicted oxidoreductase